MRPDYLEDWQHMIESKLDDVEIEFFRRCIAKMSDDRVAYLRRRFPSISDAVEAVESLRAEMPLELRRNAGRSE